MKRQQRGDAMTIVLIVLVVALAGILGYVAWKNHTDKEAAKNETTTTQPAEQPQPVKETERVLAFETWGVEVPLGDSTTEFSAKHVEETDGPKAYEVNAKVTDTCDATIGRVIKTEEARTEDKTVTVGDATYMFVPVQQVSQCGDRAPTDDEAKAQEKTSNTFRDTLFTKLRATKQ